MSEPANQLTARELARYSRHLALPEVGREGQERLRAARVLVIGAGGLGSPAALYLAAAGVGTLGIAEFDRIEEHNLQRQILHDTPSVGQPKGESARRRLLALNPGARVNLHAEGVTAENARGLFADYDIIVDGSDNFGTRYLNNDAAFFTGKPLVYGSILRFEGQVSLFHPAGGGPCYRCLFPRPPAPGAVPNCQEAGVFGALCGIIGSTQAMEALKWILGIGESLAGRLSVYDALASRWRTLRLKPDPACPLCGAHPEIKDLYPELYAFTCEPPEPNTETMKNDNTPLEIDVVESRRLLSDHPDDTLLLDVREPHEREIATIDGTAFVPMGELPERLEELPRGKHILVHCHHGGRSLRVTQYLRAQGFARVSNVAGGIDAWSREIEPEMPRY